MTITDAMGYTAASLVLATFCAKRMVYLRALAIASNLAFMAYGLAAQLWPILMLHAIMLPLNVVRLRGELAGPSGRIPAAEAESPLLVQLRPPAGTRGYMRKAPIPAIGEATIWPGRFDPYPLSKTATVARRTANKT